MTTLNERIEIKKTPKLGLTKETKEFVKKSTKEWAGYQKKLVSESARFLLNSMKRGMRVARLVEKCKRQNEGLLTSPDITVRGQKYWVLRYGPPAYKVTPPNNFPTGYTVFTPDNHVLRDLEKCKKICKLYRIWEEIYLRPFKIPRSKTVIQWVTSMKKKIFDDISKRRQAKYTRLEGSEEERCALEELDEEVYLFHETDMELLALEEKLVDLQFDLFEHPSDANIQDLVQIICRFRELMPLQRQYLDRRLDAWQKYRNLLERKYKVCINFDFNMAELGFAAFIDLMKYVLFDRIIPEAVVAKFTFGILKDVGRAKVSEVILNFLVHYGGTASLNTQIRDHVVLLNALNIYTSIWENEIPSEMVRLP